MTKSNPMPQIFQKILLVLSLLAATLAQAQLSIEITGAGANRIPVAIANFAGDAAAAQIVAATVRSVTSANVPSPLFRYRRSASSKSLPTQISGRWS